MTKTEELRNTFIKEINKDGKIVVNELNGNYFSGADVAICDCSGGLEVYRVIVVKHEYSQGGCELIGQTADF